MTAHTSIVGFRSWTVSQARIRRSVFSCRWRVRAVILANDRVTDYSLHCDIVFIMFLVLIYLIVFITDYFIRKCHNKRILIYLFEQLVYIFVGWTVARFFGWFFSCLSFFSSFFFVVGWLFCWLWFIPVLAECSPGDTTIISLLCFTKHKSSADHKGWQPGCKWTS